MWLRCIIVRDDMPWLSKGGIVSKDTIALCGNYTKENDLEYIIPLDKIKDFNSEKIEIKNIIEMLNKKMELRK